MRSTLVGSPISPRLAVLFLQNHDHNRGLSDWWESDVTGLLTQGASRIAVMQVADLAFRSPVLERLVPGDGAIPLERLLDAILSAGFSGPFELEILGSAIESEGYESAIRRSFSYLTALLAGPDQPLVG